MTQHYPDPHQVSTDVPYAPRWPSKFLKRIIERDGLIVPILVNEIDGKFQAADNWQAERVMACRELGFETILVETEWEADDL